MLLTLHYDYVMENEVCVEVLLISWKTKCWLDKLVR